MNLLLLSPDDLIAPDIAVVATHRYPPRPGLWPPAVGRRLRVGMRNGAIGAGEVEKLIDDEIHIRVQLDQEPPAALPLILLLAMQRPKMLRRMLRTAAEIGIKRIYLINSARVDKSYWQSPLLRDDAIDTCLCSGLEQVCDTRLPDVYLRPRLRPFVEDELPAIAAGSQRLLAHPAAARRSSAPLAGSVVLAIGPEGGFTEFELTLFAACKFQSVSFGPRILRSETALPFICATLFARSDATA